MEAVYAFGLNSLLDTILITVWLILCLAFQRFIFFEIFTPLFGHNLRRFVKDISSWNFSPFGLTLLVNSEFKKV